MTNANVRTCYPTRNLRSPSTRTRTSRSTSPARIETLETRTLFSNINWVNEGNDGFIFFGANQNVAREIVNKAIGDWERVIVDFNYDDTGSNLNNTFNLTINAASMGFGARGSTSNTGRDDSTDRKPTSATVTLDDDGGGLGWYFDPNIFDDGEYTKPINLFAANVPFPGGPTGSDFYRTVTHEIGHALGISLGSNLKLSTMAVDSGTIDPHDSGSTLFTLQTFGGPDPEYTITTDGGAHLWEGDGAGGLPLREHPDDLMNDGRTVPGGTNRRQLISDADASLLRDVYNYQILPPSQINTFAANLDTATGVLTINGNLVFSSLAEPFGLPNDFIDLEWGGGITMTVELAGGSVASEQVFEFQINSIVVNTGTGEDSVEINGLPSGKSVTVNLGEGNDSVVFGGEGRYMSSIQSHVTVNGNGGANSVAFRDDNTNISGSIWTFSNNTVNKSGRTYTLNDIQTRTAHAANNFNNTFFVNSIPADITLNLNGNGGSEAFEVGNNNLVANILGTLNINGGGGSDFLRLNDAASSSDGDWNFNTATVSKQDMPPINYQSLEGITANAGAHNDEFDVFVTGAPIALNGGGGNDTFYISSGDLDAVSRATIMGGTGDDLLVLDDSTDTSSDAYLVTAAAITKPGNNEGFQAVELNTQIGLETERTILIANDGSNTITVNGGRGLEIKARAGADAIVVNDHVQGSPVVIEAGTGSDVVDLNPDGVGTVTAEFREDQDLSHLSVRPGARLNVSAGSNATIDVGLDLTLAGLLDLNDNTMIVREAAGGGSLNIVRALLAAGHNGGLWNGSAGITSTLSGQSPAADGIGYATANQLGRAEFSGIPISGNDLVLDHTAYGDANLDHSVDSTDFNILASNFGQSTRTWGHGDFNYDEFVNSDDFALLATNFGTTATARTARDDLDAATPMDWQRLE